MSITLTNQERTNFQNAVIIAAVISRFLSSSFITFIYYGINHTHPKH